MLTLNELINEYNATGAVVEDAGNGCIGAHWLDWDDDIAADYGNVVLHRVPAFRAADLECQWLSDFIFLGGGDNPYRIRFCF